MSEKTILVSACLLGTPCRYDGKSKPHRLVQAFLKASHARVIPICPEVMGGLLTPRPPAEIQGFTLLESDVRRRYGVNILGVISPGQHFEYAGPDTVVAANDLIIVSGDGKLLEDFANRP